MRKDADPTDRRIASSLPASQALQILKAAVLLVVVPIAWNPIAYPWHVWFPLVVGGGGVACLLLFWLDRGIRQSSLAMMVSVVAFGTHAAVMGLGLQP